MKRAINYMHDQEFPISFLYPYSIPFYRKMGWEIVSDKLSFTVKDTQLPKARPVKVWWSGSAWNPKITKTYILTSHISGMAP